MRDCDVVSANANASTLLPLLDDGGGGDDAQRTRRPFMWMLLMRKLVPALDGSLLGFWNDFDSSPLSCADVSLMGIVITLMSSMRAEENGADWATIESGLSNTELVSLGPSQYPSSGKAARYTEIHFKYLFEVNKKMCITNFIKFTRKFPRRTNRKHWDKSFKGSAAVYPAIVYGRLASGFRGGEKPKTLHTNQAHPSAHTAAIYKPTHTLWSPRSVPTLPLSQGLLAWSKNINQ